MAYDIKIYETSLNNTARFSLGTSGSNPLFVIGLNPSTADDKKPDHTIQKVTTFARQAGFDSFIMLNLYPLRTTFPYNLPQQIDPALHNENLDKIVSLLSKYSNPSILAAWGETIRIRTFFKTCLSDILKASISSNITWLKIGHLTASNHPRHPSRPGYKFGLTPFDVDNYPFTNNL
jgi:hypothetical protein